MRWPTSAASGGANGSSEEASTAVSPTTSPGPIVATVVSPMATSAVPLLMQTTSARDSPVGSAWPEATSISNATLATAARSASGKSAKNRVGATRERSAIQLRPLFPPSRSTAPAAGAGLDRGCSPISRLRASDRAGEPRKEFFEVSALNQQVADPSRSDGRRSRRAGQRRKLAEHVPVSELAQRRADDSSITSEPPARTAYMASPGSLSWNANPPRGSTDDARALSASRSEGSRPGRGDVRGELRC